MAAAVGFDPSEPLNRPANPEQFARELPSAPAPPRTLGRPGGTRADRPRLPSAEAAPDAWSPLRWVVRILVAVVLLLLLAGAAGFWFLSDVLEAKTGGRSRPNGPPPVQPA